MSTLELVSADEHEFDQVIDGLSGVSLDDAKKLFDEAVKEPEKRIVARFVIAPNPDVPYNNGSVWLPKGISRSTGILYEVLRAHPRITLDSDHNMHYWPGVTDADVFNWHVTAALNVGFRLDRLADTEAVFSRPE